MELSNRLIKIAEELTSISMADIGTDHAYIPIYLCKNNKVNKAIASDVNPQPLEKAKHNIKVHRLEEKIETRLGNGLEKIESAEVQSISIAGMGGMLMIDILNDDVEKTKSFEQLVLQPQLDVSEVRKYLHKIGFKIVNEVMLYEDSIFYTILNAKKGIDHFYTSKNYLFGKILIEQKDSVLKKFLKSELEKQNRIQKSLEGLTSETGKVRLEEVKKLNKIYREVYQCL